jgi:hypothetical protein
MTAGRLLFNVAVRVIRVQLHIFFIIFVLNWPFNATGSMKDILTTSL